MENEIDRLLNVAVELKEELRNLPTPRVYMNGALPVRFSIIPLQHLNELECKKYDSVSEAIYTFRSQMHHEKTILHEKEYIIRVLEKEFEHAQHTLNKIVLKR